MKLTKTVQMFGIAAVLLGTTATHSFALPANEIETTYYTDATYTTEVGYTYLACQGGVYREGRTTRYSIRSATSCRSNLPPRIACYVEGLPSDCPPDICDAQHIGDCQ